MLKLIIGKKGTGKTKILIDAANAAAETEKGHITFINNGTRHMFDIKPSVRLVDTSVYKIDTYDKLYGFICGAESQDYDITKIFVDSITKIVKEDISEMEGFLADVDKVTSENGCDVFVTVSIDEEEAPKFFEKYI